MKDDAAAVALRAEEACEAVPAAHLQAAQRVA